MRRSRIRGGTFTRTRFLSVTLLSIPTSVHIIVSCLRLFPVYSERACARRGCVQTQRNDSSDCLQQPLIILGFDPQEMMPSKSPQWQVNFVGGCGRRLLARSSSNTHNVRVYRAPDAHCLRQRGIVPSARRGIGRFFSVVGLIISWTAAAARFPRFALLRWR